MKLICGVTYDVQVQMPSGRWMKVAMAYGGASVVDANGHHVAGGMWERRFETGRLKDDHRSAVTVDGWKARCFPVPGTGRTDYGTYDDNGVYVMVELFLTRREYDWLVTSHPTWMREVWPELGRKWRLAGCEVSGTPAQIQTLREFCQDVPTPCDEPRRTPFHEDCDVFN